MKKLLIVIGLILFTGCQTKRHIEPVSLTYSKNAPCAYKSDNGFIILNAFMHQSAQATVNVRLDPINDSGEYKLLKEHISEKECIDAEYEKIYFFKGRHLPKNTGYPVIYGGSGNMKPGAMFSQHKDFSFKYKANPEAPSKEFTVYSTHVKDEWYRDSGERYSATRHIAAVPAVVLRESIKLLIAPFVILTGG